MPAIYRPVEAFFFDTCTLKCGYCYYAETGMVLKAHELDPYRDPARADQVAAFFNKRTTREQKWHLLCTGGEPLLMPNLRRFCEHLFEQGNRVSFYTALMIDNAHPSFKFLLDHGAPEVQYLMASFHPEAEVHEEQYWERVRLLREAGHNVILRLVGHPARLHRLDELREKCEGMDIAFYPTTLFSKNYPQAYSDEQREKLSSHFTSLSQAIQLAGGVDTRESKCYAGSRLFAVHFPSGDIWPCISVQHPVLGNIYQDRLDLLDGAIACPAAGVACVCDIHYQQNIVIGTEDNERFEQLKERHLPPLGEGELTRLLAERNIPFTTATKQMGEVQDDSVLFFSKEYVKQQYLQNFAKPRPAAGEPRPDVFLGALTPVAEQNPTSSSSNKGPEDTAAAEATSGCGETIYQARPVWEITRRPRRPAISDTGFDMPGFTGHYYMWPEEYALLAKYVDLTEGAYLEIGSMCGIIAMSFALKYPQRKFVCVDAFIPGHATIAGNKEAFLQNLRAHSFSNVTLVEGNSLEVVPKLAGTFEIVLIDANHAYDYVLGDVRNVWPLLKPGGFVAFHDYDCVPETSRAVDDFLRESGACLVESATCLAVIRKPAEAERAQQQAVQEQAGQQAQELESLRQIRQVQTEELESLRACSQALESTLRQIEDSAGWRALNRWRRLRDSLAPEGTVRRRWYDALLKGFRGRR